MIVRPTQAGDITAILSIEADKDTSAYIGQSSRRFHQQIIDQEGQGHFVFCQTDGRILGFAILNGLQPQPHSVEFRRIAIGEKGKGYGRQAILLIQELVFAQLGAHRLWLDVFDYNSRARHLYQRLGFVEEGTLRECVLKDGEARNLVVMSMLKREWEAAGEI